MSYPEYPIHPNDIGFSVKPRHTTSSSTKQLASAIRNRTPPSPPYTPPSLDSMSSSSNMVVPTRGLHHVPVSPYKRSARAQADVKDEPIDFNASSSAGSDTDSTGGASDFKPNIEDDEGDESDHAAKKRKPTRSTIGVQAAQHRGREAGHRAQQNKDFQRRARERRRNAASTAAAHPLTDRAPGRNEPYTPEEDWALFQCLYPMASPPDLTAAMAATGRDKIVSDLSDECSKGP